jgi:nitroreductase
MDAWEAVRMRRAVRNFDGRALPPEAIERICDAGRMAPSSMNEQRWDFIVCGDRDHLAELARVGDYADHIAGAAVAIALITPEAEEDWRRESIAFDLGQAAENMMLVARAMGIGSVHGSVYDYDLVRSLLGYPETHRCDTILSFGYPADPSVFDSAPSARKPLEEMVHRERW